jgi:hypothetical protein
LNITESAQQRTPIIEASITSAYIDDREGVATEGRSLLSFTITSSVSFGKPFRFLLGFRTGQPEKVKLRDGKYIAICGLDPFEHIKAIIPPFQFVFDNLGDGQLGCYIRLPLPNPGSYRMVVVQPSRQTKDIDELIEVEEDKDLSILRAVIRSSQTIRIEEIKP